MQANRQTPPLGLTLPFIDHVRLRFRVPMADLEAAFLDLVAAHWADVELPFDLAAVQLVCTDKAGNFDQARQWSHHGTPLFRVLAPGRSTRGVGHLVLDGKPCRLVRPEFFGALAELARRKDLELVRADVAVDDDRGLLSPDTVARSYDAGEFMPARGGRPRLFTVIDPRRGDRGTGWTVYVGKRGGPEFVRVYDKHMETAAKLGEFAAASIPRTRVRAEVEFTVQDRQRSLPWEIMERPGDYLAGHSPFMAALAVGCTPVRVGRVVRDAAETALMQQLAHCRNAYGHYIDQACFAFGGDEEAERVVLGLLRRAVESVPVAGVLSVVESAVPDRNWFGRNDD